MHRERDLAPGQPQRSGNCKRRFVMPFCLHEEEDGGGGGGGQVNELPRQKLDGQDSCQRSEGLQADK